MIEYRVTKPTVSALAPYVEAFVQLRLSGHCLKSKDLLPRPGVIWMFANAPLSVDEKQTADNLLIGIHQKPVSISWQCDQASAFFVKFSPFGMSRFLDSPISRLTNNTIDGAALFGRELEALHRNIVEMNDFSEKVKMMEIFLIQRLNQPTAREEMVRNLAEAIRHAKDSFCLGEMKNKMPLSNRQGFAPFYKFLSQLRAS